MDLHEHLTRTLAHRHMVSGGSRLAPMMIFDCSGINEDNWLRDSPNTTLGVLLDGATVVSALPHAYGVRCDIGQSALQPKGMTTSFLADGDLRFAQIGLADDLLDLAADEHGCQAISGRLRDDLIADAVGNHLAGAALSYAKALQDGVNRSALEWDCLAMLLAIAVLKAHDDAIGTFSPEKGGLARWQLERVVSFIVEHLAHDTTLAELAAIADLSPAHFCRAFKMSTGKTITRWRTERRIVRGKEMLADPHMPITEIALACGFSDHSHFGRVFREHIGVAPSIWRRGRNE